MGFSARRVVPWGIRRIARCYGTNGRRKILHVPRPDPEELPRLRALGRCIRMYREVSGLTRHELARRALISIETLRDIETARKRTRASTLERLADVLSASMPTFVPRAPALLRRLLNLGGAAVAPESPYPNAVRRRLLLRFDQARSAPGAWLIEERIANWLESVEPESGDLSVGEV